MLGVLDTTNYVATHFANLYAKSLHEPATPVGVHTLLQQRPVIYTPIKYSKHD